ncbi:hypothetical protein RDI58_012727 [Solanum bulbocastanum]|uniref:TIR domain-containing protein n=1 Tax=Solanum bulbocastanum TaxID=147425 RepID=A0AAN8TI58_SOLBU
MEEFEQQKISVSLPSLRLEYDVFLSFRGGTREKITKTLYDALDSKGIRVFRDSEELSLTANLCMKFLIFLNRFYIFINYVKITISHDYN